MASAEVAGVEAVRARADEDGVEHVRQAARVGFGPEDGEARVAQDEGRQRGDGVRRQGADALGDDEGGRRGGEGGARAGARWGRGCRGRRGREDVAELGDTVMTGTNLAREKRKSACTTTIIVKGNERE